MCRETLRGKINNPKSWMNFGRGTVRMILEQIWWKAHPNNIRSLPGVRVSDKWTLCMQEWFRLWEKKLNWWSKIYAIAYIQLHDILESGSEPSFRKYVYQWEIHGIKFISHVPRGEKVQLCSFWGLCTVPVERLRSWESGSPSILPFWQRLGDRIDIIQVTTVCVHRWTT